MKVEKKCPFCNEVSKARIREPRAKYLSPVLFPGCEHIRSFELIIQNAKLVGIICIFREDK